MPPKLPPVTGAAAEILLDKAKDLATEGTEVVAIISWFDGLRFCRGFVGVDPESVPMNPPAVTIEPHTLGLMRLFPIETIFPLHRSNSDLRFTWGTIEEVTEFRAELKALL